MAQQKREIDLTDSFEKVPVKIGMGGINQGYITHEGIERAITAMTAFRVTIGDDRIKTTLAFGTSALRNARNGEQVVKAIESFNNINALLKTN